MKKEVRDSQEIIKDIKELITKRGYIYSFCMILFEDFHVTLEDIHQTNVRERLSQKEASFIVGLLIQQKIDLSIPESPYDLFHMQMKTYKLLKELQDALIYPLFLKLEKEVLQNHEQKDLRLAQKEFFGSGAMMLEPMFYSGTGAYDFQYLEFLSMKYKYDQDWLLQEKRFNIHEIIGVVSKIKEFLQLKSKKVNLINLKENLPLIIEKLKKNDNKVDWEKQVQNNLFLLQLYQYKELFIPKESDFDTHINQEKWQLFYKDLLDLFVFTKSDLMLSSASENILDNFCITSQQGLNYQFQSIGDYNIINSHPIIKLDEEKMFLPITFLLSEAIYESPYYWMTEDKNYSVKAGKNRGEFGEEITYKFLLKVFGKNRCFKSVKVQSLSNERSTKKRKDDTDIDILCVLGSKALCVQVKSKKLTQLSRKGDDNSLAKDFQGAIQNAYEQGIVCRKKILDKKSKFISEYGKEINLLQDVDDVYIMCVTTENYLALTHQANVMLDKNDVDPYPIVLSIFDLDLFTHYLTDPYDFLYYIRQRTSLMEYYRANEEIDILGYHLTNKLWKSPEFGMYVIDNEFGKKLDQDYCLAKLGQDIKDKELSIKSNWQSNRRNELCNQLKTINSPKIVDIIFCLLDWSIDAIERVIDFMVQTKIKTLKDSKQHNLSVPPDSSYIPRVGLTYISFNSDRGSNIEKDLSTLCKCRKYKSKGDIWIGFGSLRNSQNIFDLVYFDNEAWEYNKDLENLSNQILHNSGQALVIGKKIGRNEMCPCGSGLKYKKCCGK